ncbi:MAG: DUF1232 domain-containing protein [Lachnospiraceae bacterium]|nr:DUF1232 domain-containing protein [Lachnospiraceae bacterium]
MQKKIKTMKKVGTIGAIVLAGIGILYGVSPIDFIPDLIPGGIGLIDDLVIGALSGLGTLGAIGIAVFNVMKEKRISPEGQSEGAQNYSEEE